MLIVIYLFLEKFLKNRILGLLEAPFLVFCGSEYLEGVFRNFGKYMFVGLANPIFHPFLSNYSYEISINI